MGDSAPLPNPAAIARAELFTREQFVYEGETLEEAFASGSARRRAFDAALSEIEAGKAQPSVEWRRHFSLLLGLERLLSEDEPHLVDGTVLSAHQVDALSGTLTALLAEEQRNGNGGFSPNGASGNGSVAPAQLASSAIPGEEEYELENGDAEVDEDEEPQDWQDPDDELDEDVSSLSSRRTPTRTAGSGSSTRPAPARQWPHSVSSRRRGPAGF